MLQMLALWQTPELKFLCQTLTVALSTCSTINMTICRCMCTHDYSRSALAKACLCCRLLHVLIALFHPSHCHQHRELSRNWNIIQLCLSLLFPLVRMQMGHSTSTTVKNTLNNRLFLLPVFAHCLQVQSIRVCQCDICNVHGFLAGGGHSSWHQGQHQAAQCHALPYQDLCRAIRSANILPNLLHASLCG